MAKEQTNREKVKNDKIFNNRYKSGEGHRDSEDFTTGTSISADPGYSDNYLNDVYNYEETLDYNIGVTRIFEIIESDKKLNVLLNTIKDHKKVKLSKDEINELFSKLLVKIHKIRTDTDFYSPIYILEAISSVLGVNSADPIKTYKKIFDCLDVDIQQELIIELNQKYDFIDDNFSKKQIH